MRNATLVPSGINLTLASIDSTIGFPADFQGAAELERDHYLPLNGRLIKSGYLSFDYKAVGAGCTLDVKMNGVSGALASGPMILSESGSMLVELSAAGYKAIKGPMGLDGDRPDDGYNTITWVHSGSCAKLSVERTFFSVRVSAVDPVARFTGSYYSHARIQPQPGHQLTLPFAVGFWMIRDKVIYTSRGYVVILTGDTTEVTNGLQDTSFGIQEQGTGGQGIKFKTVDSSNGNAAYHRYFTYGSAVGQWEYHVVAYGVLGGNCQVSVTRRGLNSIPDSAKQANLHKIACAGTGRKIENFDNGAFELRLGVGFAGELNNFEIRSGMAAWASESAMNAYVQAMNDEQFLWTTLSSANVFLSYTFNDQANEIIQPTRWPGGAQANYIATLEAGSYVRLMYGARFFWESCPGTSYFSPESVCNTWSIYEHGVCEVEAGEYDTADDSAWHCRCNEGYYYDDCHGVCPGGEGNSCNGHGECYTTNDTSCLCDLGYVGKACELTCPGLSATAKAEGINLLGLPCLGEKSRCVPASDGISARCICDNGDGPARQGLYCERIVGVISDAVLNDGCRNCEDANAYCDNDVCRCKEGYYRWFSICRAGAAQLHASHTLILAACMWFVVRYLWF